MKVAIYCRLSAEDRDKLCADDNSVSIQNQKDMLIKHAISNGWEIFSIYSDDDYSRTDRNRPEFNRLIQDTKARKFDIVLCKSQSRFTRELELVEQYIHTLFPTLGSPVINLNMIFYYRKQCRVIYLTLRSSIVKKVEFVYEIKTGGNRTELIG